MAIGGALVWKQRIEYIKKENPHFGQVIVEATFLGAMALLFTSPFVNLVESSKKAEYMSSWGDYQVKYHKLSYKYCMRCYLFIKTA
jgi:DNA modification methylase